MLDRILVPIHREGWRFAGLFALATLLLWWLWTPLGWLGLIATLWCIYFFRDPPRVTPIRPGLVVAPADGVVQSIEPAVPPAELGMPALPLTRIGIFMNVFDVHVNRMPVDGTVLSLSYRPGKFFNASLDKASEFNERQSVRLRTPEGQEFAVVQIAGLVARRIRCDIEADQSVRAGERFGLIRFGSRVDVYLPEGTAPLVVVGQRSVAGETVLADLQSNEPMRRGEMR
ncbi:MAG TPA: phosphatidylserine decarboxylase [Hypericibacter adhaerens]|uniref:phosphatidylserine decarboxylase n=1 Tax=Hypericibacter adhaerens TaxID=2602016 RepID=UPI002B96D84E|nr:phosphatidylserine decarboxylase [Hypericibacter adhaerens]HWA41596.1 phosphatidylserine decarboxylase [Hypericibacter adhaerens]